MHAEQFSEVLTGVIRDLCHAYIALHDRRDWAACARTIYACHRTLAECTAFETGTPPRRQSMSRESLLSTIACIVSAAHDAKKRFDAYLDDPTTTVEECNRWADTTGREMLNQLTVMVGDLVQESSVRRYGVESNAALN